MPRGRKRKVKFDLNIKPDAAKSIFSIVLIFSAGITLISFFASDYSFNAKIQDILRSMFGMASILVPLILLLGGLLLIEPIKFRFKSYRVLFALIAFLLLFATTFHIFYSGDKAMDLMEHGNGGGLIGYKISQILRNTISVFGGVLFLLAGYVGAAILLLNVSLDEFWNFVTSKIAILKGSENALGKNNSKNRDEIVISSGYESANSFSSDDGHKKAKKVEPSFEIIPSLSEPLATQAEMALGKGNNISITPTLPYSDKVWEYPPFDLLDDIDTTPPDAGDIQHRAKTIKETLRSFGINVEIVDVKAGPSVTQYVLEAEGGTKISKIASLQYDLALALASPTGSVRIEAPIPGKSAIGIEVPNNSRVVVNFKSLITAESMKSLKSKIGIVLGKDVGGQTRVYDIGKMPHLLVAGSTGSGKSVFLHSLIFSILFRASPQECKFIMIDPKRVELIHYSDIPHLMTPVVTDLEKAPSVFKWAVAEMERRYKLFEAARARNIDAYNEKSGFQALPYIVIIVDELAEIMVADPAGVEKSIIRLGQLARATGIHLILAVQRPSTNIITGVIKANIPARVAFNVTSQIDSRVIIDQPGAEKLLGKGDMLFVPPDVPKPNRLQGAMVSDREISKLVTYLKNAGVAPEYKHDIFEISDQMDRAGKSVSAGGDGVDDLFNEAVEIVTQSGKASASLLQRRLAIGYARAARILDELEGKGIISTANGSKPREVLQKPANPMPSLDEGTGGGDYAPQAYDEGEEPVETIN